MKLWNRGKEMLIKKVFHLKHWGNHGSIKKTRETITPIIDTAKLCYSKYFIKWSQG